MVAAGLTAGCTADSAQPGRHAPAAVATHMPVAATGRHQAGITLPQPAQGNLLAVVADLGATVAPGPLLAELGQAIRTLTTGTDPRLLGLPPGDLTVTVGVGPGWCARPVPRCPARPTSRDSPANGSPHGHAAETC